MDRKNVNVVETAANAIEPRPRNVLIYSRVSALAQAQNMLSSDDQIAQLVGKSKREGDDIVGIFRDEGETGTNMTIATDFGCISLLIALIRSSPMIAPCLEWPIP
jgi:site-specific DNA recombinase